MQNASSKMAWAAMAII